MLQPRARNLTQTVFNSFHRHKFYLIPSLKNNFFDKHRPVIVEIQDETEDDGGMQEAMLPKRNQDYQMEREVCI